LASLTALERVAENAHWFSDVVAAIALGLGGVWLVRRLWWDVPVVSTEPLPRGIHALS
jgi:membrane-associated phospholipid phosphatase